MATHYRDPERGVRVAFFGGELPSPELLAAAGGAPISLRVRPDALEPEQLPALLAAGVDHIELDALTLDDHALRDLGRRYTGSRVLAMAKGLRSRGLQVGAVLSPGLPRTSHDTAVRDAEQLAPHLHTARVHPALVIAGSRLEQRFLERLYTPLTLGEAVTACVSVLDRLEDAGVEVIRVGLQPKVDGYGRAVAGPLHSSLRELAEGRRVLVKLRALLANVPAGSAVILSCSPRDRSRTRGPLGQHLRSLRADLGLSDLVLREDASLARGSWQHEVMGVG